MNSVIFSLERKTFLFAGMGFAILMLIVLFCAFAVGNGSANRSHMVEAQTAFTADVETRLGKWRADLEAIEASGSAPSPYEARPMNIRLPVTLPPSPLADFAIGASDLHPSMTTVTTWSNQADLFSGYEFSNPSVLGIGRFDLAFVVAVLLPLLMIVASFDAAAGDRDRGLARMTAAQPVRFPNLVWTRLLLRNLYIWAAFLAIVLAVAVFNPGEADPGQRLARFALWAAAALLYGVFWFALIGFVVAVAR